MKLILKEAVFFSVENYDKLLAEWSTACYDVDGHDDADGDVHVHLDGGEDGDLDVDANVNQWTQHLVTITIMMR